ncbi:MAG TPA: acyl carrier protein [Mycobacteriales bacterium]|nr:acyl carrier protein [Mycobacteriales bacterium]
MSGPEIPERVRGVLSTVFDVPAHTIDDDASMDTVAGWDSLQQLTVVLAIEEEFGIALTDDEVTTMVTFPLIVAVVSDHLAA